MSRCANGSSKHQIQSLKTTRSCCCAIASSRLMRLMGSANTMDHLRIGLDWINRGHLIWFDAYFRIESTLIGRPKHSAQPQTQILIPFSFIVFSYLSIDVSGGSIKVMIARAHPWRRSYLRTMASNETPTNTMAAANNPKCRVQPVDIMSKR